MKMTTKNRGQLMNVLFTMLLFLVFVLCALFTVLIGGKVYENINSRMEDNYTGSVALNYVANKVRQGDKSGVIDMIEVDGVPVLQIKDAAEGSPYVTWIYYLDGSIRELYMNVESGLTLEDGLEILKCGGMNLTKDGRLLTVETMGEGGSKLLLSLRSGGPGNDQ